MPKNRAFGNNIILLQQFSQFRGDVPCAPMVTTRILSYSCSFSLRSKSRRLRYFRRLFYFKGVRFCHSSGYIIWQLFNRGLLYFMTTALEWTDNYEPTEEMTLTFKKVIFGVKLLFVSNRMWNIISQYTLWKSVQCTICGIQYTYIQYTYYEKSVNLVISISEDIVIRILNECFLFGCDEKII